MRDDLLNFLVATDSMDEFLGYEPKCPNCGRKLIETSGGPSNYKDSVNMRGSKPYYSCNNCRKSYSKDLKEII